MISGFEGEYRWLSNFWPCDMRTEGDWISVPTLEHAYQAAKAKFSGDLYNERLIINAASPGQAKRLGRYVNIKPFGGLEWEDEKVNVMTRLLRVKFSPRRNPDLVLKLLDTEDQFIVEMNDWGDTFWGVSDGRGFNMLGSLIMQVRTELRKGLVT